MGILLETVRSDKRNVHGFFGLGGIYEIATATAEFHFASSGTIQWYIKTYAETE